MSNPGMPLEAPGVSRAPRRRVVAVIDDDCTACNTCVDYCLVDCIEPAASAPSVTRLSPVTIREDECIGCVVCAKICEELGVNAIHLMPAETVS